MKKVLGLDLGTNSIGWALVEHDFEKKEGKIDGLGSRIIPMAQNVLDDFGKGVSKSQTGERTGFRGARRLYERDHTRRERLHRVLNILGFLPPHYAETIDFDKRPGQFKDGLETKLNYILKPRPKKKEEKDEFIFMTSFLEMAREFEVNGHVGKIPYDWTLYYLRKKALEQPISEKELAWIILNFNQKRGYYQARGEEADERPDKLEEYLELKVVKIEADENPRGKDVWYNLTLENGDVYRRKSKDPLDSWLNKTRAFIKTTPLDDGKPKLDKNGAPSYSLRAPKEDDWKLIKTKTENALQQFNDQNNTVGVAHYIYHNLLQDPRQKIRGKLVKTIERKYYKEELKEILRIQSEFHQEFKDRELYDRCVQELYPRNEAHQANIKDRDLIYLLVDDIIFYQRPLKSKKSSIANCQYEFRKYKDKDGNEQTEYKKGIPRSHPLFQEFRLWQFLKNLKIKLKEEETDVTNAMLPTEVDWVELFDFLKDRKEVEQKHLIEYLIGKKRIEKKEKANYRWNYVEDKPYPCGETRAQFLTRFSKMEGFDAEAFLTKEVEYHLWHLVYSVKDPKEYEKALGKFALRYSAIGESRKEEFVENFKKFPPYPNDYGSYSEKALKKIVPLMRMGSYWNEDDILPAAKKQVAAIIERLESIGFNQDKIDANVADDALPKQLLKSFLDFENENPLKGLNTYQACYAVYGRHSETNSAVQWKSPADIDRFLKEFKQHSLRNPIVEQVVTETLRVVRDIWLNYGAGAADFFDEIHVELGREMKNPSKERERITNQITENQNTNERVRKLLEELMNDGKTEGEVRPYSPSHQEILKIYEEGVSQNPDVDYSDLTEADVLKFRKNVSPTKTEITRYKLWLDQGYISPYTGKPISLSRLFTEDYQIEHVIPQSRYFDDSLNNKVICESAVNALKDNDLAYEFIRDNHGRIVELGNGKSVKILGLEEYKNHCARYFKNNKGKLKRLLADDVPEGFIQRQMNDTRYISKLVKGLLSNIVREENELEATSKHIVTAAGAITSQLKQDWGLNDKWNELIAPRFKRLNELTGTTDYGYWDEKINAFRTQVPEAKGFNKKRIDHRHHALDALVMACITKDHVNYITSLNTNRNNHALVSKLRVLEEIQHVNKKTGEVKPRKVAKAFHQPWPRFTMDAYEKLLTTVVSFKQNLRVINKANNRYMSYKDENGDLRLDRNGKPKKALTRQTKGSNWAIRKPMHAPLPYGERTYPFTVLDIADNVGKRELIQDDEIRVKVEDALVQNGGSIGTTKTYLKKNPITDQDGRPITATVFLISEKRYRKRQPIDKLANRGLGGIKTTDDAIKYINKVSDLRIREDLLKHLREADYDIDVAFSSEGIEGFNVKRKIPVYKLPISEASSLKFPLGEGRNTKVKFGEAESGTNLFFGVYWNEEKEKREFETVALEKVIKHQKKVAHLPKEQRTPIEPDPKKGTFLFALSPNDLVYVPTDEEKQNANLVDFTNMSNEQVGRIYKMVSTTKGECHFVPAYYANPIIKNEAGTNNKSQNTMYDDTQIKSCCWKLEIGRLGEIKKIIQK